MSVILSYIFILYTLFFIYHCILVFIVYILFIKYYLPFQAQSMQAKDFQARKSNKEKYTFIKMLK